MNRNYKQGNSDSVSFFVGEEIEKTPAYGKKTLFVNGIQSIEKIKLFYHSQNCEHIFFGANHSFNPEINNYDQWKLWEDMIMTFLKDGFLCTLDIPITHVETFHDSGLCEYNNFIPQIRISIPYVQLWNYNTMIKIDDRGFNQTNPGVWCHSLHNLKNREKFTEWSEYNLDTIIE